MLHEIGSQRVPQLVDVLVARLSYAETWRRTTRRLMRARTLTSGRNRLTRLNSRLCSALGQHFSQVASYQISILRGEIPFDSSMQSVNECCPRLPTQQGL